MAETIVLTCAGGKQCARLIPLLYNSPPYHLHLVVNSQNSLERLKKQYPNAEVVTADLTDTKQCRTILKGATAVYHAGPSFHPREAEMGLNMVDAAVAEAGTSGAKFKHFVYSSVLNPQFSKMLNHDRKKIVEEYLMESGLHCWTILQPTHFGDLGIGRLLALAKTSEAGKKLAYQSFIPSHVEFSYISLKDLGEVSARVIKEREKHFSAYYPLSSTGIMTYAAFVKRVGKQLGVEFEFKDLPYEQAVEATAKAVFGTSEVDPRARDGVERMILFYRRRGVVGNPNVMGWLLDREPTDVEGIVQDVKAFSG